MIRFLCLLAIILLPIATLGQSTYTLGDSATFNVNQYEILPDNGYTFNQVLTDPGLSFRANDSIRFGNATAYWIKVTIENPSRYPVAYEVRVQPNMDNTLYYWDRDTGKWVSRRAGILTKSRHNPRLQGIMPCVLEAKKTSILYMKVDVSSFKDLDYVVKPPILFKTKEFALKMEENMWVAWAVATTVLFLFFLNNLYIYFSFRDKTILYYLIAQLGGMIYILSYRHFLSVFFYCPLYTFLPSPSGVITSYDLNYLLMHVGILCIMYGFAQFTRSFFDTAKTLPKLDLTLKYGLIIYLSATVCIMVISSLFFCLEYYTSFYENLFALFIFVTMSCTCIVAYRQKLRAASPFLFANMLPLIFMVATPIFHLLVSVQETSSGFLPYLAGVAQSLGFSIALVARTRLIQSGLKAKELEARQLEFNLRELTLTQKLTELENQKINAEIRHEKTVNEILQQRLDTNQRELASTTMYIVQKNKLLSGLKGQIQELHELYPENQQSNLKNIESILKSDLYLDADWEKFKLHFEQVHPRFFEELRAKHPNLTKNEIRIYAYFHINLSTKEIASLLNIDPASVRRAKTRLYKKMSLSEEV